MSWTEKKFRNLSIAQLDLIIDVLNNCSDEFANHGCNDLDSELLGELSDADRNEILLSTMSEEDIEEITESDESILDFTIEDTDVINFTIEIFYNRMEELRKQNAELPN